MRKKRAERGKREAQRRINEEIARRHAEQEKAHRARLARKKRQEEEEAQARLERQRSIIKKHQDDEAARRFAKVWMRIKQRYWTKWLSFLGARRLRMRRFRGEMRERWERWRAFCRQRVRERCARKDAACCIQRCARAWHARNAVKFARRYRDEQERKIARQLARLRMHAEHRVLTSWSIWCRQQIRVRQLVQKHLMGACGLALAVLPLPSRWARLSAARLRRASGQVSWTSRPQQYLRSRQHGAALCIQCTPRP